MSNQEKSVTKKRGRPKSEPTTVIRLPVSVLLAVDDWIAAQPEPRPSRPEAIRRLLEKALTERPRDTGAFIPIEDVTSENDE